MKSNDIDEMMNLLELVVGVAVMCEDKNVFIPKIFELNDLSQVCVLRLTLLIGVLTQNCSFKYDHLHSN